MNKLVEAFGTEKRWVSWKYKLVKGGKKTKVPYSITGAPASSTDVFTWNTYDEVKASTPDNLGIIFTPDQRLLGIDIDKCLEGVEIVHEYRKAIVELILDANTYCEISPSKTGLHLFLRLTEPLALEANKKAPFELYTSGRYFTVTECAYGQEKDVRTVTPEEAIALLTPLGYPWAPAPQAVTSTEQLPTPEPTNLGDDELLRKMFASKNGQKIEALYGGDINLYQGDHSNADMALLSHLAFWTGGDPVQMERLWLGSPLGQRSKTFKREDYRRRSINNALANCKEYYKPFSPKEQQLEEQEIKFLYTENKKSITFTLCTENICRILRPHSNLRFDEFRTLFEIRTPKGWKELEDADVLKTLTDISIKYDFFQKVQKGMVYDAMLHVAKENSIDSAADYLRSLVWDGTARISTWIKEAYGVEMTNYYRSVGENWLKGLVKRIIVPGSKFDTVLVLEGKQGMKKSTSLQVIGGSWHVETTMSTDSKDFFMLFQGKAIIEFSEGETMSRTDVKRMKGIISNASDKFRMPYERVSKEFPRRCVFAMTTNESEYLKDDTGNRRWLPVKCEKCDIEWLKANRGQLLAEAYHRAITLHETTYEFPEDEMEAMHRDRRIYDASTDKILDWFMALSPGRKEAGFLTNDVFEEVIQLGSFAKKPAARWELMSIASVLKDFLYLDKKKVMRNGINGYRWFPGDKTPKPFEQLLTEAKIEVEPEKEVVDEILENWDKKKTI